jgi:hypothetical protein
MTTAFDLFRREHGGLRREPPGVLVGASLGAAHRERLVAALLATRRLTHAELTLHDLTKAWAPEESAAWLRATAAGLAASLLEGPSGSMNRPEVDWAGIAERLGELELVPGAQEVQSRWYRAFSFPAGEIEREGYEAARRSLLQAFARLGG